METIYRVLDFFPAELERQARAMLAGTLKGIISQRLVRTEDGRSRVPAVEVMVGTSRMADAILNPDETGTIQSALAEGSYYGMQSFDQSLLQLVLDGAVGVDEAMFHSSSKQNFALLLEANSVHMDRSLRRSAAGSQAGDELGFEATRKGRGAVPVPIAPAAPQPQHAAAAQGAPYAPVQAVQPMIDPAVAAAAGFLPTIGGGAPMPAHLAFPGVAQQQAAPVHPSLAQHQPAAEQAYQGVTPQQPRPQPGITPDLPGHHAA
jgi:hypothetical protein